MALAAVSNIDSHTAFFASETAALMYNMGKISPHLSNRGVAERYKDKGKISMADTKRRMIFFIRMAKMAIISEAIIKNINSML